MRSEMSVAAGDRQLHSSGISNDVMQEGGPRGRIVPHATSSASRDRRRPLPGARPRVEALSRHDGKIV